MFNAKKSSKKASKQCEISQELVSVSDIWSKQYSGRQQIFALYYLSIMASKFTCNEVLGLLFADPDSEGEYLPSEDDGDSFSDYASDASLPSDGAAGQSSLHQAQTLDTLPNNKGDSLPNVSGGDSVSRGRGVHRDVSRRGTGVENEAGSSVGTQSFYRASHVAPLSSDCVPLCNLVESNVVEPSSNISGHVRRGRSVQRRAGGQRRNRMGSRNDNKGRLSHASPSHSVRGAHSTAARAALGRRRGGVTRGRGANKNSLSRQDDGNAGFECLTNEEEYQNWIKPFDQPIGYRGGSELSSANSPLDFLSLFLSDDFWNVLVTETNRYAHQFLASNQLKPHSRFHQWSDVTVSEMKAFISLHLSMGLVEKSEIEDYWAEFWPTATAGFGKVMSRKRFEMILSFLHFANNEEYVAMGQPGYDRLFKIRPIIDLVIPQFAAVYGPSKQLSLDEMTIAFKGKSTLKMYNPNKPDKYGYKVFVLCEAKSGYVLQWSMYTGQSRSNGEFGATHFVVRELMAPYTGKGHEVYMDSYYTSPAIADELASSDTGMCGTVSSKRKGMPKGLTREQLPLSKGDDPVFMRKGRMLVCAWHDTKRLTMLSTLHGNTCVRKRIRSKHTDNGYREINRPACVDDYNQFMGGVDTADQRMKTYLFPHRSRKWYFRIFNSILSVSMVNSHIIYCRSTAAPHKSLKVFVQGVIIALLEGYSRKESNKGRKLSSLADLPQRLTERHFLYKTDDHPDCVVCSDRARPKGRRQTKYRCRQCGVGLCVVPCNERYHTIKQYKKCHLDE